MKSHRGATLAIQRGHFLVLWRLPTTAWSVRRRCPTLPRGIKVCGVRDAGSRGCALVFSALVFSAVRGPVQGAWHLRHLIGLLVCAAAGSICRRLFLEVTVTWIRSLAHNTLAVPKWEQIWFNPGAHVGPSVCRPQFQLHGFARRRAMLSERACGSGCAALCCTVLCR